MSEPACKCFTVPEERWTRHYDATEPGSMVEPNQDCPVHFPTASESRLPTLLGWTVPNHLKAWVEGADIRVDCLYFHVADTTTTSVPLGDDDAPTLVGHFLRDHAHGETVEYDPGSSSEVSSVSPEGETTPGEGASEALKARWYPVMDDTIGGWAISNVDLPVSQIDIRDGKHFTVGNFLSEGVAWHICDLHNAALSSPLPADETEWTFAAEIAGFLSTIMDTETARRAAKFLDRGYRFVPREEQP